MTEELSPDDLERRRREQNDLIRKMLSALDNGPRARRRRFTAVEFTCAGCHEAALEVVNLTPYRVLRARATTTDLVPDGTPTISQVTAASDALGLSGMERGAMLHEALNPPGGSRSHRRGERVFFPLAWPRPASDDGGDAIVTSICRCQSHELSLSRVYDALETRQGRVLLPGPRPRHA